MNIVLYPIIIPKAIVETPIHLFFPLLTEQQNVKIANVPFIS